MFRQPPLVNRADTRSVALETTLLCHGVPRSVAPDLARSLFELVSAQGVLPALVGVLAGRPIVGMTQDELGAMLDSGQVLKVNAANIGVAYHRKLHAATTVGTTMELAAAAGVRLFATGAIGGVHRNFALHPDVSSDLAALTRYPIAVVSSGVKSLLDVGATREVLESLGVPVIGFGTDRFPAFYLRDGGVGVDARFDEVEDLARFIAAELARTGRGIVIANPIPEAEELNHEDWTRWCDQALAEVATSREVGRDVTPAILGRLHDLSNGATLRANLALVRSNVVLAARLARALAE